MYNQGCLNVNNCDRVKGSMMEFLPPTQASFLQHVLKAAYQAGYVWNQFLVPVQKLPSPEN